MRHYQGTLLYRAAARYGGDDALLLEEVSLLLIDRFVDVLAKTTRNRRSVGTVFRAAFGCSPSAARNVLTRATLGEMCRTLRAQDPG